jgi:hypothetical protein
MIKLIDLPKGLDAINKRYGNPDSDHDFILDPGWYIENTRSFLLPQPLRLSWSKTEINYIRAHKAVGDVMIDAITDMINYKDIDWLRRNEYDYYGGCFCFRKMRGYPALSTHSWGIAIDICPQLGPMGGDPEKYPEFIVDIFTAHGFDWGGAWEPSDPQHFQCCHGY